MDDKTKKILIDYGIFIGLFVGMLLLISIVTLLANTFTYSGLRKETQSVLDMYAPEKYEIGELVTINTPVQSNVICYTLHLVSNDATQFQGKEYVVIVRVMTLFGPYPAVYIFNDITGVTFAGFALLHNSMSDKIEQISKNSSVLYWSERIPAIMRTVIMGENEK